jgi:predicted transcriptional regulator
MADADIEPDLIFDTLTDEASELAADAAARAEIAAGQYVRHEEVVIPTALNVDP